MTTNYYFKLAKEKLFKLNRSITGNGTLKTLKVIKKEFPDLKIKKIRCGTKVFDWKVPPEWNVNNAYIEDKNLKKILDFRNNNLHLVGYSKRVKKTLAKNELIKKFHYLKNQPTAIPYVTSYYKRDWGFCLSYNKLLKIKKIYSNKDKFKILIDSKFNKDGNLNYGEILIGKKNKQEILISTYICHPSMANNELSGPIISMALIKYFKKKENRLNKNLRFIFIPETIGSISYIYKNLKLLKTKIIGGYNLSCLGNEGCYSIMMSKYKNSPSDFALIEALKKLKKLKIKEYPYTERGSDERQFNSPGVNLGITSIFRKKYFEYPEYHTSLDNFDFITSKGIKESFDLVKKTISILDKKIIPKTNIICEPFMTKRNLYPTLSRKKNLSAFLNNCMDLLQYSDGKNTLEKISEITKIKKNKLFYIYKFLRKKKLLN